MVNYLRELHEIVDPHYSEEVVAEVTGNDYIAAVNGLMVNVRFTLDRLVREAIQQAADRFREEHKVVQGEIKYMALTGKLVLCSPFVESIIEDKRCSFILSNNEQMDNRMVVLSKVNPFNIGDYALMPYAAGENKVGIRFAVKFNLDDVQGGVSYTINEGY